MRPLSDFVADARALDPRAFASRHGRAFLLRYGGVESLRPTDARRLTALYEPTAGSTAVAPQLNFLVFPINATTTNHNLGFISIGRTPTNDVMINDVSVTQLHAVVSLDAAGRSLISDAGSSGGTFVNDERVPIRGEGAGTPLRLGDRVRLGAVEVTFLPAAQFMDMVRRLAP